MTIFLYLNPAQKFTDITIPQDSFQHVQNRLQNANKSYKNIFQITLENVPEGIVGIYTENEGRYYRISTNTVARVNECFSRAINENENEKISCINALVDEIIDQPNQYQWQMHIPGVIPMNNVTELFKKMTPPNHTFGEILICCTRYPGSMFYVGVCHPNPSEDNN